MGVTGYAINFIGPHICDINGSKPWYYLLNPGGAMTINVQYHNGNYDLISADTLQRLIVNGKIKKFYRYSENKWVIVGQDPIRSKPRPNHEGSERRTSKIR